MDETEPLIFRGFFYFGWRGLASPSNVERVLLMVLMMEGDPFNGHVLVFWGRRGDLIKLLWWTGAGLSAAKHLPSGA